MENRAIPEEHKEIARGSGAAAILLFLQIAACGYLGFTVYYLFKHGPGVFWSLTPFSAAWFYYFPAAFAVLTYMPTDALTRTVARTAVSAGILAGLAYGWALITLVMMPHHGNQGPGLNTALAVVTALAAALLIRFVMQGLIGRKEEKDKKRSPQNDDPE